MDKPQPTTIAFTSFRSIEACHLGAGESLNITYPFTIATVTHNTDGTYAITTRDATNGRNMAPRNASGIFADIAMGSGIQSLQGRSQSSITGAQWSKKVASLTAEETNAALGGIANMLVNQSHFSMEKSPSPKPVIATPHPVQSAPESRIHAALHEGIALVGMLRGKGA